MGGRKQAPYIDKNGNKHDLWTDPFYSARSLTDTGEATLEIIDMIKQLFLMVCLIDEKKEIELIYETGIK